MRIAIPLALVCAFLALAIFTPQQPHPPRHTRQPTAVASTAAPVYTRVCLPCHGTAGEGKIDLKTPSIAGQPTWYLATQLKKFRLGHRGGEPRDTLGQQMRAIALTLSDTEIDAAVATVAKFPSLATRATIDGADLNNGREIYQEQCIDCHRYNGSGEKAFGSSPLTSFQDWYLATQIEKFRQGIRGYHPDDEKGQQMRHLISYLSPADTRDVSAYIASLAQRYPPGN